MFHLHVVLVRTDAKFTKIPEISSFQAVYSLINKFRYRSNTNVLLRLRCVRFTKLNLNTSDNVFTACSEVCSIPTRKYFYESRNMYFSVV